MDVVKFTITKTPELYLEAENITPDAVAGKSAAEIADLPLFMGNQTLRIGDYFTVEGKAGATAAETKIIVAGDLTKVKWIGAKMTGGEVEVLGTTDMYTGARMQGGKIIVKGDVNAFCAIGMTGGELIIEGNAGNYLGAAPIGDWKGMQGGKIVVKGSAGSDVGDCMNGGTIDVGGDVDVHLATHADGGTIIVRGTAKGRVGGQMVKGDIYVLGGVERMMPSFKFLTEEVKEFDGKQMKFQTWIGDLGERHGKRKGEVIYGNIYVGAGEVEAAAGKAPARAERRAKLNEQQIAQVAAAFKDDKGVSVQKVSAYISENFGLDLKPMAVSRLIDTIKR